MSRLTFENIGDPRERPKKLGLMNSASSKRRFIQELSHSIPVRSNAPAYRVCVTAYWRLPPPTARRAGEFAPRCENRVTNWSTYVFESQPTTLVSFVLGNFVPRLPSDFLRHASDPERLPFFNQFVRAPRGRGVSAAKDASSRSSLSRSSCSTAKTTRWRNTEIDVGIRQSLLRDAVLNGRC